MMALRGITMDGFAPTARRARPAPHRQPDSVTRWEFDFSAELGPPPPPPGTPDPLDRQDLPSLFTVLPEQLGLKLQAAIAPVPVLVIEGLTSPTPD
jgi:uncharacterized protein (TIGR03435 family)